ncbi:MAG: hypothetical protein AB1894_05495 [Chloroflexota bacterium]
MLIETNEAEIAGRLSPGGVRSGQSCAAPGGAYSTMIHPIPWNGKR